MSESDSGKNVEPSSPAGVFEPPPVGELSADLPQYEFSTLFASDRTGALYRARQDNLDRDVCVKVLPPVSQKWENEFRDAFQNEAVTMAKLTHPNIVQIYDFGQTAAGLPYFVMEYVEGNILSRIIKNGEVSANQVLQIIPQVCTALDYAHVRSVVHCDIRPANILLTHDGEVKVANFGFSTVRGRNPKVSTSSATSLAMVDYLAPELRTASPVIDHRVDIYAIGVVVYEMLTGEVPRGAWQKGLADSGVDPVFGSIVEKAMAPDPGQRFQSALEIRSILERIR